MIKKFTFLKLSPLIIILYFFSIDVVAQNLPIEQQKYIFFPHPLNKKWTTALGVTATTLPYDITEELHYRIPAAYVHVSRKIGSNFSFDTKANIQVLQNLIVAGPRFSKEINDRFSYAVGDEFGYWFGFLNFAGFKSKGSGFQNTPYVSLGYRFNKQVLLSLRADAMLDFGIKTFAGNNKVTSDYNFFSGSSYTLAVEQPFYGKRNLILGFRAMYTNFFWQTWAAFESFDRNIFFPQLIIAVIL